MEVKRMHQLWKGTFNSIKFLLIHNLQLLHITNFFVLYSKSNDDLHTYASEFLMNKRDKYDFNKTTLNDLYLLEDKYCDDIMDNKKQNIDYEELYFKNYHPLCSSNVEQTDNILKCNMTQPSLVNSVFSEIREKKIKDNSEKLKKFLIEWYLKYGVPKATLTALLHGLRQILPDVYLPLDARTLLKVSKSNNIFKIGGGEYCHFGLQRCLEKIIEKRLKFKINDTKIKLLANVDGSPTSNSSARTIWPILGSDTLSNDVYIIGLYVGVGDKPDDPNSFLRMFTDEYLDLYKNGFYFNNVKYEVHLHALICDAQAKAFALCIKYPSGYNSCTKCTEEGEYYNCVCFTSESIPKLDLRTDKGFKEFIYSETANDYQQKKTILTEIPNFGLVTNVPLDIMHLIYIG